MSATGQVHPPVTLDMRGTSCPAPLLGAKKLVDDLRARRGADPAVGLPRNPRRPARVGAIHRQPHCRAPSARADGGHAYHIERGRVRHPAADAVLDLRGLVCPGPIVEAKKL